MRVAMLVTAYPPEAGGAERQAHLLARALQDCHGVEVTVFARGRSGFPTRAWYEGVHVVRMPLLGQNRWAASASYLTTSLAQLATRHSFDAYHCVQAYSPATIGALAGHVRGGRVIVKVTASNLLGEAAELRRLPFFDLRMRLFRRVDAFVALTPQIQLELEELGIEPTKIVLLPNGVAIPPVIAREARDAERVERGLSLDAEVVTYTGRLSAEKGLETLLDAFAEVARRRPRARLFLVGDGGRVRNVEDALRAHAARLPCRSAIHFVGQVEDVTPYLRIADVFVLPSRSEGMSNALLEAMAHGIAPVVTDIDANRSLLTHGEDTLKVPVSDVPATARALERALGDVELRARLGAAARRRAARSFSIETVAERYLALYRQPRGG